MNMPLRGRPLNFPDPMNDVTIGNPTYIAPRDQVLRLYNQNNPADAAENYCQRVRDWFMTEAIQIGWSNAVEAGNNLGILLHVNVQIVPVIPGAPQGLLPNQ